MFFHKKILIVDDDASLCNLIAKNLIKHNYEVACAYSGQEALDLIKGNPQQIVLLDQKLLDMTGKDVVTTLYAQGINLKFIIMTGEGDERLAVDMMKLGAIDYLIKGFDLIDILLNVLKRAFHAMETEYKLAEATHKLYINEERLRIATQSTGIGIWDYDVNNDYLYWNEQMFSVYGKDPARFNHSLNDWKNCVALEARPKIMAKLQKAFADKDDFNIEFPIITDTGEKRYLAGAGKFIPNENGHKDRFMGVNYDITQRKKLEFELQKAKNNADNAAMAKSIFLANMSHEIRTPMNVIIGMSDVLSETNLNEDQRDYLSAIVDSSEFLLNIINDILDYSKMESGKLSLNNAKFNIKELLCKTINNFQQKANSKNLKLTLHIHNDVPDTIINDPFRLQQVVINLLSNAIKFTDVGEVVLSCSVNEEDVLQISVRDTGVGIAEDQLDLLFERFSQVDTDYQKKLQGTGLGLAICKQLVTLMGGQIFVHSQLSAGSDFYFTVPNRTTS